MEIWKDIPGYVGQYQVSNLGNVKSLERQVKDHLGITRTIKPCILKQRNSHKGYRVVSLTQNAKDKNFLVHRLVGMAFIENPENKPQINHIDGNKQNNCVENLEWCTNSENQKHAYKLGLNKVGKRSDKHKCPVLQIDILTNQIIAEYPSIVDASRKMGRKQSNIGSCCKSKYGRKTAFGYKWRFKKEVDNGNLERN